MNSPLPRLTVGDESGKARSAPTLLRQLVPAIHDFRETLDSGKPIGFVGCGSSLDVAEALARVRPERAIAVSAADFTNDPDRQWIGVTRGGRTRELLDAMAAGTIAHVITCDPSSDAAEHASTVLDLSIAEDSGHVAAVSTLITAAAISVILSETPESEIEALDVALRGDDLGVIAPGPVVWLGPWSAYPLAREFVRKSVETQRRSSYAHTFEFLHGDDLMYADSATWCLLDSAERISRFDDLSQSRMGAAVTRVTREFDWDATASALTVGLLAAVFSSLFDEEAPR